MPMKTDAAKLHAMHKRKAERLWKLWEGKFTDEFIAGKLPPHYFRVANLAAEHALAAGRIYNCPDAWERSETDRKLIELRAWMGNPLYDEWRAAVDEADLDAEVESEYRKMLGQAEDAQRDSEWQRTTEEMRRG